MIPEGASRRRALTLFLVSLALVAAVLAVWAALTGGFRTYILGVPLSVRGAFRPALVALVAAVAALHLADAWRWPLWTRAATKLSLGPPIVATGAALAVLLTGVVYGTKAAGGSDVYGYVSQASLWAKGTLVLQQDFIAQIPWPNAAWSFSPLGYRPADIEHTIMPTYAPGTALLMALLLVIVGSCGPYLVGPLCGGALVLLTYRLGVRVCGPIVGLIAACAIATSPTVIFMTNWPMSDVPAATFWTASLLAALGSRARSAAAAGALAGIAIVIRPNLAPLAIVPAALAMLAHAAWRQRLVHVVAFGTACVPFIGFIAWLFNHLYGSPLRSGYGDLSELYAWSHPARNLRLYAGWFLETQGVLPFACVAAPVLLFRRDDRDLRIVLLFVFALLLFVMYLFYAPFDFWTYLRFLLPGFPIAFILSAEVTRRATAAWRPPARAAAMLLFAAGLVGYGWSQSDGRNVLALGASEQKFADVGKFTRALPENAVIYAQQHGGNVRFYGNRLSLRFDLLDPAWLDRSLEHLRGAGYVPYLLLEEWEVPQFRAQFAGQAALALLDRRPLAVTLDGVVRLYGTGGEDVGESQVIPKTAGCVDPHPAFGSAR